MSLPVPGGDDQDDPVADISIDPDSGDSHVIDDSHYSHQRRLQAIHNAHDRVIDVRNAVEDRLISNQIDEYHARRYYRGAVEAFLMEIMPVLQSDEIQLSENYRDGFNSALSRWIRRENWFRSRARTFSGLRLAPASRRRRRIPWRDWRAC